EIPCFARWNVIEAVGLVNGDLRFQSVLPDRHAAGFDRFGIDVGNGQAIAKAMRQQGKADESGPGAEFEQMTDLAGLLLEHPDVFLPEVHAAAVELRQVR